MIDISFFIPFVIGIVAGCGVTGLIDFIKTVGAISIEIIDDDITANIKFNKDMDGTKTYWIVKPIHLPQLKRKKNTD